MSELKAELIGRITRLAGLDCDKDRVRNPCITARESIMLADYIVSLRREVEELKGLVRELLPHADEQAFTMIHRGEVGGMEAVALIRRAESTLALVQGAYSRTRGEVGEMTALNELMEHMARDAHINRRERIATAAMQGFISTYANPGASEAPKPEVAARWAVRYADALIAQLDREEGGDG